MTLSYWKGARHHGAVLVAVDALVEDRPEVLAVDVAMERGWVVITLGVRWWWPVRHPLKAAELVREVERVAGRKAALTPVRARLQLHAFGVASGR